MRNQAYVLAALAAVAIGCGGGGGGGDKKPIVSTSGGGMNVTIPANYGSVEVAYLSGQGRALDDLYLRITRQTISNPDFPEPLNVLNREGIDPREVPLDAFTTQTVRINVPFAVSAGGRPNSLNYPYLTFDPDALLKEAANGDRNDTGLLSGVANLPIVLDARIRVFPGRRTNVPLFVSSATLNSDSGALAFDADLFRQLNYSTADTDPTALNRLAGRLSDFVRFPLTNVPPIDRPNIRLTSDVTDVTENGGAYVYFSGDNVAISNLSGGANSFQEITESFDDYRVGNWLPGTSGGFQGTYDLRDDLPSNPNGAPFSKVSNYGGFRNYTEVLSGGGTFEIVMFPNSGETYAFEGTETTGLSGRGGDIVALVRNSANQIVNLYFGSVDLDQGTFEMFPIYYLGEDPGFAGNADHPSVAAARRTGRVGNYRDANGNATQNRPSIRTFSFDFNDADPDDASPTPLPSGFVDSGTVTVFRR